MFHRKVSFYFSLAAEQMDQVSNRSGVGSDDITDESASLLDVRWSSEEEVKAVYIVPVNIKLLLLVTFWFMDPFISSCSSIILMEKSLTAPLWVRVITPGVTSHRYHTCCCFSNKKPQRFELSVYLPICLSVCLSVTASDSCDFNVLPPDGSIHNQIHPVITVELSLICTAFTHYYINISAKGVHVYMCLSSEVNL